MNIDCEVCWECGMCHEEDCERCRWLCCTNFPNCPEWTSEQEEEFNQLLDGLSEMRDVINDILDEIAELCLDCVPEDFSVDGMGFVDWIISTQNLKEWFFDERVPELLDGCPYNALSIIDMWSFEYNIKVLTHIRDVMLDIQCECVELCEECERDPCECLELCEECERNPCECEREAGGTPVLVDRTALATTIEIAQGKVRANFTVASWSAFVTALEAAQAAYANPNATQAQINTTRQALITAMNGLVAVVAQTPCAECEKYPCECEEETHNRPPSDRAPQTPQTGDEVSMAPFMTALLSLWVLLTGAWLKRRFRKN
jgi:hypothetical protein